MIGVSFRLRIPIRSATPFRQCRASGHIEVVRITPVASWAARYGVDVVLIIVGRGPPAQSLFPD